MKNVSPFPMLFLRFVMFALFQSLLALVFFFLNINEAWKTSQGWWIIGGLLTNIVTFIVMQRYFSQKGIRYFDNFRFIKNDWWKDVLLLIGILIITVPLAMLPNTLLVELLYGSDEVPLQLFFRSIPLWLIIIGFFWAITQGIVELPFYFAYLMPRLEKRLKNGWSAWMLASLFLALQHVALPLIFDWKFIVWRFGMFLLFAFFIGLCLKLRPRLFPYIMIVHSLMDIGTVAMFFTVK
ncbi:MAG: hypothetical protein GZ091_07735 [Paludibacter sp.]|nr:hypothetical protein [Paludibacter sp.]